MDFHLCFLIYWHQMDFRLGVNKNAVEQFIIYDWNILYKFVDSKCVFLLHSFPELLSIIFSNKARRCPLTTHTQKIEVISTTWVILQVLQDPAYSGPPQSARESCPTTAPSTLSSPPRPSDCPPSRTGRPGWGRRRRWWPALVSSTSAGLTTWSVSTVTAGSRSGRRKTTPGWSTPAGSMAAASSNWWRERSSYRGVGPLSPVILWVLLTWTLSLITVWLQGREKEREGEK